MYGVKTYRDDFHNKATIKKVYILPYFGAKHEEKAYKLSCFSMYDDGFCYHVSIYETEEKAIAEMMKLSCGTWKEGL